MSVQFSGPVKPIMVKALRKSPAFEGGAGKAAAAVGATVLGIAGEGAGAAVKGGGTAVAGMGKALQFIGNEAIKESGTILQKAREAFTNVLTPKANEILNTSVGHGLWTAVKEAFKKL